jgi:hypothetical protein
MDCSTWFLVENQSKMTYPLPLGFQHVKYCGESLFGALLGSWCGELSVCMLNSAQWTDFCVDQEYL